jgi:hypothetical protein
MMKKSVITRRRRITTIGRTILRILLVLICWGDCEISDTVLWEGGSGEGEMVEMEDFLIANDVYFD